jgi:hypothetical protein
VYFIWLKYLSWLGYANEVLLVNQWDGINEIKCSGKNETVCLFKTGDDVLDFYKMDKVTTVHPKYDPNTMQINFVFLVCSVQTNFGLDLGLMGAIYGFCRVMTLVFLTLRAYLNRK